MIAWALQGEVLVFYSSCQYHLLYFPWTALLTSLTVEYNFKYLNIWSSHVCC